ncbi:tyrosine-type recombinase/integrase [Actinomyces sp.]|uniref:tyrosine-type recombinase/integrase n=1 Tax=Actinomyces sp. TaxID=29317 RepID=UPI00289937CD|nr:tyrosine-type recombinase/integrase [Actinomyces sp.]
MAKRSSTQPKGAEDEQPKEVLPRGITKLRDKYRVRVTVDGQRHFIGLYDTLDLARKAQKRYKDDAARGTFVAPIEVKRRRKQEAQAKAERALTVRQWADMWLDTFDRPDRSVGTVVTHRSKLNAHILPIIGDTPLVDVTPEDIDQVLDKARRVKSRIEPKAKTNGVTNGVAMTLKAMFNAAVKARAGGLTVTPFTQEIPTYHRVRDEQDGDDVATPEEVQRMADAMPERYALSIHLAAWCALRLGEILGLQRRDFEHLDDPDRAILHVRRQWNAKSTPPTWTPPKAESRRTVAIPAAIVPLIRHHLDTFTAPTASAPLFASMVTPTHPIARTTFDRAWSPARNSVRPGFRFHSLRHTGLTAYARQGATLTELMRRGGHRSVSAALRYQHADAERDRALTKRLDTMIEGTHA